jgi:hypothetical protein
VGCRHIEDGGDAHMKIRGERVEDLVGAHVGVGVDDTLAAALHIAGCEGSGNAMASMRIDCALALSSNVGWTWGEILEVQLRLSILRGFSQFTPERTPHDGACAC